MTDELVELAKSDDELISVLAHEVGHVRGGTHCGSCCRPRAFPRSRSRC